jgi:hypothetical protein
LLHRQGQLAQLVLAGTQLLLRRFRNGRPARENDVRQVATTVSTSMPQV